MTFFVYLASVLSLGAVPSPYPLPDDGLVIRLGSEDWRERRQAYQLLGLRGLKAIPALERGLDSGDPEISRSCASLKQATLSEALALLEPVPMIDAMWYVEGYGYLRESNPGAHDLLLPYLYSVGRDCQPWHNYRTATRLVLADLIELGVPPEYLKATLAEMRRRDAVFLRVWNGEEWRVPMGKVP